MRIKKLSFLFFKRYFKKNIPSMLISLIIFCLIGIVFIATALPFKLLFFEEFSKLPAEMSMSISQHGITTLSHEQLQQEITTLSLDETKLEYGLVISLKASINDEELVIPFIGLSNFLMENMNLSDTNEIYLVNRYQSIINVTNPNLNNNILTLSITENNTLNKDILFDHISWIIRNYNLFSQLHGWSSVFLVGNFSYAFTIAEELQITTNEIGVFFIGFLEDDSIERFTIDQIENKIEKIEISLFQKLVTIGFKQDFLNIHSPARNTLELIKSETNEEIGIIQRLSIPNIILILILIFALEIGLSSILRKKGYIFWSRGLSKTRLKIVFFSFELLSDLIVSLLVMGLFSISIYLFKLPSSTIISLLFTYLIVFALILLSKLLHFFTLEYFPKDKVSQKNTYKTKGIVISQKIRTISSILFIISLMFQIFAIIEPLFWFPIISNIKGIIFDIVTSFIILVNLVIFFFSKTNNSHEIDSINNMKNMLKRLFKNGLKEIRIHHFAITGLNSLLILFLLLNTTSRVYTNTKADYRNIFDFTIYDRRITDVHYAGFNLSTVENLPNEIPEIRDLSPFNGFGASIIGKKIMESTSVYVFNSSKYANLDLVWDHFIGMYGKYRNENPFNNLDNNSILINEHIAEKIGARVGDKITLSAPYFDILDNNLISIQVDNLEVIGIVDTLPVPIFTYQITPFAFIDYSLLEQMIKDYNLGCKAYWFSFNLDLNNNETLSSQEKQNEIISSIISQLNVSSSADYIIVSNDENEIINIFQAESKATKIFIWFEICFIFVLLPIIVLILSNRMLANVLPSLKILGSRGYSIKNMRKVYNSEIFTSLISSVMMGLFIGMIIGLIYIRYFYPKMYIATSGQLWLSIISILISVIMGGIISFGIMVLITTKSIKSVNKGE